jgi:hypothetical protein
VSVSTNGLIAVVVAHDVDDVPPLGFLCGKICSNACKEVEWDFGHKRIKQWVQANSLSLLFVGGKAGGCSFQLPIINS